MTKNQVYTGSIDGDIIIASVLTNVFALFVPFAMLQLFDRVIPNQSVETLEAILVILLGVIVADTVLKVARARLSLLNARRHELAISRRVIDKVLNAAPGKIARIGQETVLSRFLSISKLRGGWTGRHAMSQIDMLFSVLFLGLVWTLGGLLVFAPITIILLVAFASTLVKDRYQKATSLHSSNDDQRMSFLIECFRQTHLMKVIGAEQQLLLRYEQLHTSSARAVATLVRISDQSITLSATVGQLTTGLTSLAGAYLVISGKIGLANLAACILLTARSVQPFVTVFFASAEREVERDKAKEIEELFHIAGTSRVATKFDAGAALLKFRDLTLTSAVGSVRVGDLDIPSTGIITVSGPSELQLSDVLLALAGELPQELQGRIVAARSNLTKRWVPSTPLLAEGKFRDILSDPQTGLIPDKTLVFAEKLGVMKDFSHVPGGLDCEFVAASKSPGTASLYYRLALAAALGDRGDLVLLDNPMVHLDPRAAGYVSEVITSVAADRTIIIADPEAKFAEVAQMHIDLSINAAPHIKVRTSLSKTAETLHLDSVNAA